MTWSWFWSTLFQIHVGKVCQPCYKASKHSSAKRCSSHASVRKSRKGIGLCLWDHFEGSDLHLAAICLVFTVVFTRKVLPHHVLPWWTVQSISAPLGPACWNEIMKRMKSTNQVHEQQQIPNLVWRWEKAQEKPFKEYQRAKVSKNHCKFCMWISLYVASH